MTGSRHTGRGLDARRRKLLFRSWHRGMRETDLILGSFADGNIDILTDEEIDQYEKLLDLTDTVLLPVLTGQEAPPHGDYAAIIDKILASRQSIQF